ARPCAADIRLRMIADHYRVRRRYGEVLHRNSEDSRIWLTQPDLSGNQDLFELMLQPGGTKLSPLKLPISIADQPYFNTRTSQPPDQIDRAHLRDSTLRKVHTPVAGQHF